MRRTAVIAATVLALALVFGGIFVVFTEPAIQNAPEPDSGERQLYRFEGDDSGVWNYLSPSQGFRERSPINVVVRADADTVVTALKSSGESTWNQTDPADMHADPEDPFPRQINLSNTAIDWGETTGTARYAYVYEGTGDPWTDGEWIRETDQLHNGDYYGHRTHIRLYESPVPEEEPWVAMQVHTEHFDWFTLRHAVDGVEEGQRQVEKEFMSLENVDVVWRAYLSNGDRSDADGWATFVELTITLPGLLVGWISMRDVWRRRLTSVDRARVRRIRGRLSVQQALLMLSIVAIVLGVRAGGILLEWSTDLSMHAIAAVLYPFISLGIPIVTYVFSHRLTRRMDAAVTASGALGIAFLLDYSYLGVEVLPIEIVVQRTGIILALGLIAGGAAKRATRERRLNRLLVSGLLLWVGLLVATLFQFI